MAEPISILNLEHKKLRLSEFSFFIVSLIYLKRYHKFYFSPILKSLLITG